jgi:hypothetical protein
VGSKKCPYVVERSPIEIFHVSDRGMTVRMTFRKGFPENRFHGKTVRSVLIRLPALILHDVALIVELGL